MVPERNEIWQSGCIILIFASCILCSWSCSLLLGAFKTLQHTFLTFIKFRALFWSITVALWGAVPEERDPGPECCTFGFSSWAMVRKAASAVGGSAS